MNVDVLVVGGQAVGLAVAVSLCDAGFSVCVVDAATAAELPHGQFALRVSAITRGAEHLLTRLGAWSRLPSERIAPFEDMRVWDASGSAELHFGAADIGEPHLGVLLENDHLVGALRAVLDTRFHDQCQWRQPATLEALHVEADGVLARISGEHVSAALVVGADGARSRVRELSGLATHSRDYGQSAVAATLRTELPHRRTAWQRFLPGGPIALLPLPGEFASIVWSTSPDEAAALVAMEAGAFNRRVRDVFDNRFGQIVWSGERGHFPLRRVQARQYVGERTVLVGDAAHTIHPLAGQGLNLGLMDAATLAEVMRVAGEAGRDPFAHATLRRYERWRKTQNVATQRAMDLFAWLFAQPDPFVRGARSIGLRAVNGSGPLKRELSRLASGVSGDLPLLARRPRR